MHLAINCEVHFSFVDKYQLRLIDFLECLNYRFDTLAENV